MNESIFSAHICVTIKTDSNMEVYEVMQNIDNRTK